MVMEVGVGLEGTQGRRGRRLGLLAALLGCALALAAPALASAATFEVTSTGDQPDATRVDGECETGVSTSKCTLRAAIEQSDASAGTRDEITFSRSVFDGQLAGTISPASPLPPITDPVTIDGGDCFGEDGPHRPCTGVEGPSGGSALTVEGANDVTVTGLAVTGAQVGIDVIKGSQAFTAQNDWVGVKLDGTVGGNGTGIFIGPGSDGAAIGGAGPVTVGGPQENPNRNVISGNNGVGLDLDGASDAAIQGNYLGVLPNGSEALANATDIEITDSTEGAGSKAEGNEIGASLEGLAPATPECDDACNVISGATEAGVDLQGGGAGQHEAPASGPTAIRGNDVGLGAGGVESVPNGTDGVFAGAAPNVVVGGAPFTEGNRIVGGEYGVRATGGDKLQVVGNQIGLDGRGTTRLPPSAVGILVESQGLSSPAAAAEIKFNRLQASEGEGIEQRFTGARITGNWVSGGAIGIRTLGAAGGAGNSIQGNLVEVSTRAIVVENERNTIAANEIFGSEEAGIEVVDSGAGAATGNVIGGDTITSENFVSEGLGNAIEIIGPAPGGENEIARNRGAENAGLFIDLGGDGPGNPGLNGGIQAPTLSTPTASGVAGSAEPGATVRVFRKATPDAGELESFLGEAVADAGGSWSVAYPSSVPTGTIVAATQTSALGGTSELATATTPSPPPPAPPTIAPPCYATPLGCSPPPEPRRAAPQTKITKGPPKRSHRRSAVFRFKSSQAGSHFECRLDRAHWKRCRSPKRYKHLRPGRHVFRVRAIRRRLVDPTPAVRRFRILARQRHATAHRRG